MTLSRDCFNKIVTFLTPYMQDDSTRQSLIMNAFYGSPIPNQLDFTGDAQAFTTRLVRELDVFGNLDNNKSSITVLLEVLQEHVGSNKKQDIIELIKCSDGQKVSPPLPSDDIPSLPLPQNIPSYDHLFVSYSSTDRVTFVDRIAEDLSDAGYKVWVDNLETKYGGIIGGHSWQQDLADALNRSALIIFVITPDSIRSRWTQAELKRAGESKRPIISVLARPLTTDEDKQYLQNIQVDGQPLTNFHYRDFTILGYDQGLKMLIHDIQTYLKK